MRISRVNSGKIDSNRNEKFKLQEMGVKKNKKTLRCGYTEWYDNGPAKYRERLVAGAYETEHVELRQ